VGYHRPSGAIRWLPLLRKVELVEPPPAAAAILDEVIAMDLDECVAAMGAVPNPSTV